MLYSKMLEALELRYRVGVAAPRIGGLKGQAGLGSI